MIDQNALTEVFKLNTHTHKIEHFFFYLHCPHSPILCVRVCVYKNVVARVCAGSHTGEALGAIGQGADTSVM